MRIPSLAALAASALLLGSPALSACSPGEALEPGSISLPSSTSEPPAQEPIALPREAMEGGVPLPTTTTTAAPARGREAYRHPEWISLAISVGWPNDARVLSVLDTVIQRESNGRPEAWNRNDPHSGSYGLTQVNGFWCLPNGNWPVGFMQAQQIGLSECSDLFDPVVNLRAALVIWTRQSGFGAWSTV